MPYINQIHLIKKGVKNNKKFLELLYNSDKLIEVSKWFDQLDCDASLKRLPNKEMTLEIFLKKINKKSYIILQINSPDPHEIRYYADFSEKRGVKKSLGLTCPYEENFEIVKDIYKTVFNLEIEKESVLDGLIEYYEWRTKNYKT